jgi:hypothetical protein
LTTTNRDSTPPLVVWTPLSAPRCKSVIPLVTESSLLYGDIDVLLVWRRVGIYTKVEGDFGYEEVNRFGSGCVSSGGIFESVYLLTKKMTYKRMNQTLTAAGKFIEAKVQKLLIETAYETQSIGAWTSICISRLWLSAS